MPSAEEIFRRLGPQGVRQLQQLFDAGGYSEEEREQYIQTLSQRMYQEGESPQGIGGMGGISPTRGPLPSSTPSYAPYGPSGGDEPIQRSPSAPGPPERKGIDWQAGLMSLAGSIGGITRGGGSGGGGGVGALLAEQRRRQNQQQEIEQRFLNSVDLAREQARLQRAGASEEAQAKAAASLQERKAEESGIAGILLNPDLSPDQRQGFTMVQTLVANGMSAKEATEIHNKLSPRLQFETTEKDGVKSIQPLSGITGKPVGPPRVLVAPAEQEIKPGPEGGVFMTPPRPGYSGPMTQYTPPTGPMPQLPEGVRGERIGQDVYASGFPQKPKEPATSADLDSVSQANFGVPYNQLPQAQQQQVLAAIEGRQTRVAAAGAAAGAAARSAQNLADPIGEDASKFRTPEGQPVSPQTPRGQVYSSGAVPVTPQSQQAVASAISALELIKEYRDLTKKLLPEGSRNPARDFIVVQANRARLAALEAAGDPDARRFSALRGTLANVARATGDTANIAVEERKMLANFLTTAGDTQKSSNAVLDQAERILRGVAASRGVPVPGQAPAQPAAPTKEDEEKKKRSSGRGWRTIE